MSDTILGVIIGATLPIFSSIINFILSRRKDKTDFKRGLHKIRYERLLTHAENTIQFYISYQVKLAEMIRYLDKINQNQLGLIPEPPLILIQSLNECGDIIKDLEKKIEVTYILPTYLNLQANTLFLEEERNDFTSALINLNTLPNKLLELIELYDQTDDINIKSDIGKKIDETYLENLESLNTYISMIKKYNKYLIEIIQEIRIQIRDYE